MRLETLQSRIENAKAKIEKKQNTITKKLALIEKKRMQITKLGLDPSDEVGLWEKNPDAYWILYDIKVLEMDIERGSVEIEETMVSLEKYEKQLAGELEKEA